MHPTIRHFGPGIAGTVVLAALALLLAKTPGLAHLGALSLALLLGLACRAFVQIPEKMQGGIGVSARKFLRLGIGLLGLRLNFELLLQVGLRVLFLDATVIVAGLLGINWLGRRLGLDPVLACLIAVDSSICGGSAVAAAAPAIRAKEDDIALVIPLCSLIGTAAMLGFTLIQHHWNLTPVTYGMMAGATLHEVAQVMAAIAPFPDSAAVGTVTKLTRVVLLVPAVFVLGTIFARDRARRGEGATGASGLDQTVPKPWFVLGFLMVGGVNTLALHFAPTFREEIVLIGGRGLELANFFMAMAMAGMGLQVDFGHLRKNGFRAVGVAILGWMALATLAVGEIWIMNA